MIRLASLAASLLVVGCDGSAAEIPAECNGAVELCQRRFDEAAYPTTHNAMSNADEGWVNPNQYHAISDQLAAGVRALMLDAHYWEETAYLCHTVCQLGSKPLAACLHTMSSQDKVALVLFWTHFVPRRYWS